MGIENMLQFSKQHPFDDCKLCKYARRCVDAYKGELCSSFSQKYSTQQEYDKKEDEDMWEKNC